MKINLHIDKLILDSVGVKPNQNKDIKAAVESELKRRLVSQGISSTMQSPNNHRPVMGGAISIKKNRKPASFGQQIGNAIFRELGK